MLKIKKVLLISRTKRVYNFPNKIFFYRDRTTSNWVQYWHPYKEIYHKSDRYKLREERVTKWRRLQSKMELNKEVQALCSYEHLTACEKCLALFYSDDCDRMYIY